MWRETLVATGLICLAVCCATTNQEAVRMGDVDELPIMEELPDPFIMNDGTRVRTQEDWEKRRREIADMICHYEYGHMPPPPGNVVAEELSSETALDGLATEKRVVLTMGPDGKIRVEVGLYIPKNADGPLPVVLDIDHVWLDGLRPAARGIVERGYIYAGFDLFAFDKDDADRSDGVHPLYPEYDWATISAWAWGSMRIVDYLVTLDEVNPEQIAITGHSRRGKTALLAGALDERITLVSPHQSGEGGAGCHRIQGEGSESLKVITDPDRFHYWFHPRFREFADKENRLPFDQHFVKAMVAPRALLSVEGLGDKWANPLGTQQTWLAAQPVFDFLGASDRDAVYFREGKHEITEEDWDALLDYADFVFFGKPLPAGFNTMPFPDAGKPFSWSAPAAR